MIYKAGDPESNNVKLVDHRGINVDGVISFDTDTEEAEILIYNKSGDVLRELGPYGESYMLRAKMKISGAKIIRREE